MSSLGTRVGPYQVIGQLGAGGMGEVYRAHDTNLGRDVALKVLPALLVGDPDRLARFRREAQVLASLNHPHIAQIYGIDDSAGAPVIVMELVEGRTLDEAMGGASHHALPVDEALDVARQIAEALEAAHDAGIVHRDLKPANIKVRDDGVVKVLDFGLARAVEGDAAGVAGDSPAAVPTITSPALTQHGVVLGTAAYMSPEQAKGKLVDKRADIWAFGVVLYEMLTGSRLFTGETVSDTLASVIKDTPRLDRLPAAVPDGVRRLLSRCLERDARQRLRDIGEARIALAPGAEADVPARTTGASRGALVLVGAAGVLLAAAVGAAVWKAKPAATEPVRRFEITGDLTRAGTGGIGYRTLSDAAVSPDGTRIAYIADGVLRLRSLDALGARDLATVSAGASTVFWSADGRTIGFTTEGTIRTIPAGGGPVFTVCRIPATGHVLDAAWRQGGTIAFAVWRDSLYEVPAIGGTPKLIVPIDPAKDVDFHTVSALPDGRLLVAAHRQDTADGRVELIDNGRRTPVTTTDGGTLDTLRAKYVSPGRVLFLRSDTNAGLWAVPLSGASVDLGHAVLVQAEAINFSAAGDGTVLAELPPAASGREALTWVDRSGKTSPVPGPPLVAAGRDFTLSPDGRRAAVAVDVQNLAKQIVVRDLQTGLDTRLTFDDSAKVHPAWFPSGDKVLYVAEKGMETTLFASQADAGGQAVPLTKGVLARVAPDGRELLYIVDERGHGTLRRAPILPDGKTGPSVPVFHGTDPDVNQFDLSPDGRLLAYAAMDPDQQLSVYLTEYPGATGRWQVVSGGSRPRFSHDGRELFFIRGVRTDVGTMHGEMTSVPVTSSPAVSVGAAKTLFTITGRAEYDVTPDGQRFLMAGPPMSSSADVARLVFIQNWPAAAGMSP